MEHYFNLPVPVNGEEQYLPTTLVTRGYAYQFYVIFKKQEIIFERDEEMNFRTVTELGSTVDIPSNVINAIASSLYILFEQ